MRVRAAVAPLLLALLPACTGHLPPCPAAGGPAWTELESAHFRLRSDDKPAAARAALTDLEEFRAALLTVVGAPLDLDTGRLPVVVVDRGWTDFAPRQLEGYFTRALFQPLVVMVAGGELHRQDVIKHELVHYLSDLVMPRQPHWLSEGLATYYATIEYDADAGHITVGRPSPALLHHAQETSVETIESMFRATAIDVTDATRFYAAAWITMHYLMNHRLAALAEYEKALRAGASFEAAWTAAFGSQTPAQLAVDVRQYLDGGQYALLVFKFPRPQLAAPAERPLSDADAHATRALLYLTGDRPSVRAADDPRVDARRELGEALRQEPTHVRSRAIAHWMLGMPADLQQATAAAGAHGDDWLAWLLLADARDEQRDAAGRDEARSRAIIIARSDPSIRIGGAPQAAHQGP